MWIAPPSIRLNCAQALGCSEKDLQQDFHTWASTAAAFSTLNGKLTHAQSWRRAWKKAPYLQRLSGSAISPNLTPLDFLALWIASLRDSPAKTSALQAGAPVLMASVLASSSKSSASQPIAVRGSCFWRTSEASLLPPPPLWTRKKASSTKERPPESWENWPTSGGMRSGSLFQRPMWVPVMGAPDGSASHGNWSTPNAHDGRRPGIDHASTQGANLNRDAAQWSSPRASDGKNGGPNQRGSKGDLMLPSMAAQWPTPAQRDGDARRGATSPDSAAWKNKVARGAVNAAGMLSDDLKSSASAWPTPAARDYRSPNSQTLEQRGGGMKGEQLNNFVEHHFLPPVPPTHAGPESLPSTPGSPPPSASKKSTTPRLLTRRLNPYFGENLMGWRLGWTSTTDSHASSASETELFRCKLRWQLCCLLGEAESSGRNYEAL